MDDNLLWRSADAGLTWNKAHVFDVDAIGARQGRKPSNLLVLGEDELVLRDTSGNWLQSNDRGETWAPASNGFQHLNGLGPLAGSPGMPRALGETLCSARRSPVAGAATTLVARCVWDDRALPSSTCFHFSNDSGRTWTPPRVAGSRSSADCQQEGLRIPWYPTAQLLDVADPKKILVAWQAGGMFRSDDGGQSWHTSDDGLMFRSAPGLQIERIALGEPSLIKAVLYRDRELLQRSLAAGANINMEGNALGGVLEADILVRTEEFRERGQASTPMWVELRRAGATSVASRKLLQSFLMSAMELKLPEVVDDLLGLGYDWGSPASARRKWSDSTRSELHDVLQSSQRLNFTADGTQQLISTYIRAARFPSADQTTLDLLNNGYAELAVNVLKASTRSMPFDRQSTARRVPEIVIATAMLSADKSAEARRLFATVKSANFRIASSETSDLLNAIGTTCDLGQARWYRARGVPIKLAWIYGHCLSDAKYAGPFRFHMLRAMQDDFGIPPESWNIWADDNDKKWVTKTDLYKAAVREEAQRGNGVIGVVLNHGPGSDDFKIERTVSGLPAASQGVLAGDAIIAVDGIKPQLQSLGHVVARVEGQPGTWVRLDILRNGRPMSLNIRRQIRPPEFDQVPAATRE
ncbi:MAG: PDZ domain-containing protein [Alcaligenaceae bacterium]|nr:MAG: PDZ domain-containing protein [Alcaligenaceae bacterium]